MLDKEIQEIINFPSDDLSAWVTKVNECSTEAISGAILYWQGHNGVSQGPDNRASLREAASSILQSKLTNKITLTMMRLDKSANFLAWVGTGLAIISAITGIVSVFHT